MDNLNYIFLGPPASGKGTQAKRLAHRTGLVYFGLGELMRQEAKNKSDVGLVFQKVWDEGAGKLIPEDVVNKFVAGKIKEMDKNIGFVFDGYPRSLGQAEFLHKIFNGQVIAVNINVSLDTILERSETRRVCSNCGKVFFRLDPSIKSCDVCGAELIHRQEDKPEVVRKRIEVYNQETKPLIDYYKKENVLIEIDGEPSIDEVEENIWIKINERKNLR